jgi:hypothetical protein
MATRSTVIEALAWAGVPVARAESLTRNLAEARIIRRAPPWRPKKDVAAFAYSAPELAAVILALAVHAAADAVRAQKLLAEHFPDPETTTDDIITADTTLPEWLATTIENLAKLSAAERRTHRQDNAFIEFTTDLDDLGSASAVTARFEWGAKDERRHIVFRSLARSLAEILGERPRGYRTKFTVRIDWALLLDLTAPPKEPADESAEILPGTSAPIDDQPVTEHLLDNQLGPQTPSRVSERKSVSKHSGDAAGHSQTKE